MQNQSVFIFPCISCGLDPLCSAQLWPVMVEERSELFFLKVLLPYNLLSPSSKYATNITSNSVAPST